MLERQRQTTQRCAKQTSANFGSFFEQYQRQRQRKKSKPFSVEALELLLPETSYASSTEFDKEEDDGSSEGDPD